MSLGLSAPGFGMTITPTVGRARTLAQYRQFLSHVQSPAALGRPSTWFDASTALP